MDFYSFYKILKDMLRTLFGKKFLKITIIVILIFTIFFVYNECFAITTIPPITVDGVTFNFNNYWNVSHTGMVGNMDNVTILRYTRTDNGNYVYFFARSSYPIYLVYKPFVQNGTNQINTYVYSYDENGNQTKFYFTEQYNVSPSTTTINVGNPSFDKVRSFDTYYNHYDINTFTVLYSDMTVYLNNEPVNTSTPPSLSNTQEQLQNLSFSNFIINANSYTEEIENNDGTLFMLFYNRSLSNSQTTDGLYPIKEKGFTKGSIYTDYENSTSDNMVFSYPIFNSGVFFNIGSTYEIRFAKQVYNSEYNTNVYEYLGEPIQFTISSNVTQDYINQLNQQTATSTDNETTQDLQNSINNQTNAINNQTQSIDNINNSITNSTVDNSSINLPTDNTQDPTQNGVDNIFQTIYNSFTSGTAQDIVFPIPFTDKSITLQANYIYNMLNNNNASWIITIIQAFWWYLISRFIITDIMKKIRKIKQGNFENIQNSNIKEDML